jgi:hypothetical protein
MGQTLPPLDAKLLGPTRDRLQAAALVIGSLQRAFLPKDPHDWHYGLEVTMRGISTQAFKLGSEEVRATIDLVRNIVRLDGNSWPLADCDGAELFQEVQVWLQSKGLDVELEEPKFSDDGPFDPKQAAAYAKALWWLDAHFKSLKSGLNKGLMAPILLYPHHFDLSLVWFPHDDDRQLAIGFSTGDETIAEPYLYLTASTEPKGFKDIKLPAAVHWQADGFSGAILPYAKLQAGDSQGLFEAYSGILGQARPLFN